MAAAAGGPAEIIDDGATGLLYPPGNAAEMARILRTLAGDRVLRARLGAAAREKAREFAPQAVAAELMKVYRAVLEGQAR